MKSYFGLIHRYMLEQKKRTLLTILGITLCVALITSVGVVSDSILAGQVKSSIEVYGDYQARFALEDTKQITKIYDNKKLDKIGRIEYFQNVQIDKLNFALSMNGIDLQMFKNLGYELKSGTFPHKNNEIVIKENIVKKYKKAPKIGELVAVNFKFNVYDKKGNVTGIQKKQRNMILSGILKTSDRGSFTNDANAIINMDASKEILGIDRYCPEIYISVKTGFSVMNTLEEVKHQFKLDEYNFIYNEALLQAEGEKLNLSDIIIRLILIGIVILATIASIYNLFNISVLEKIRHYGMLRAIGSPPKYIRRLVYGEALVYGGISIPLGLLVGIILPLLLSPLLNGLYTITLVPKTFLLSALLGLITVFVSAFIPAKLAGKLSPLEAITNNSKLLKQSKMKAKRWETLIQKFTGISGLMAYRNLWRNKGRFIISIFGTGLGIAMFIIVQYFIGVAILQKDVDYNNFDYSLGRSGYGNIGYEKSQIDNMKKITGVKEVFPIFISDFCATLFDKKDLDEKFIEKKMNDRQIRKDDKTGLYEQYNEVFGFNEEMLKSLNKIVKTGQIDINKLVNEPYVIIKNNWPLNKSIYGMKRQFKIGEKVKLRYYNPKKNTYYLKDVRVAAIISSNPYNNYRYDSVMEIILSDKQFEKIMGIDKYQIIQVNVQKNSDIKQIEKALKSEAKLLDGGWVKSLEDRYKQFDENLFQAKVICYGVIIIIALISILNIINIQNTAIMTRVKEFGILQAVGMSISQLKNMIALEGTFYGLFSSLWGSGFGIAMCYVLYNTIKGQDGSLKWEIPWIPSGGVLLVCILICLLASITSLKRVEKIVIVEAIRTLD